MKRNNWMMWLVIATMTILLTACGGGGGGGTDTTKPVITILGDNPATVVLNTGYTDAGATAVDDVDGNVTVTSSGTVDTTTVGTYTITYSATDTAGNTATATRTVNVIDTNHVPTASNYGVTLDVNESEISSDWLALSGAADADGDTLTASVQTDGTDGVCGIVGHTLTYAKTEESNATDSCVLSISDGAAAVTVTVTITPLYWKQVATGWYHTVALKSDGTLWAWGRNDHGQLGDATTTGRHTPTQVGSDTDWSLVAAGDYHTVALKSDGTLWAWGDNHDGQLGDGTTTDRHTPVQVGSDTDWSLVAAGWRHTVALKSDGTLYAWGWNGSGQLGDNTVSDRYTPTQEITHSTNWNLVAAGDYHTVALKSNGTLWAWGSNGSGQLGDGTTADKHTPTQENTNATDWSSVAAGATHTVALKSNGKLYAWGSNGSGRLGDGTTTNKNTPTHIGSDTDWSSVAAGFGHTVALKSNGKLYAWGSNSYGELGDGTTADKHTPTQENTNATDWSSAAAGASHTVALKSNGTLWAWGYNGYGELGDGTTTDQHEPTHITNRY